jgi:hypothetical protein
MIPTVNETAIQLVGAVIGVFLVASIPMFLALGISIVKEALSS